MNTFGRIYRLTSFGESHGKAIGGVIDGVPSDFPVDTNKIQQDLDKRKPGQSELSTSRKEQDKLEILSGIFEGKTLGTPIGFIVRNKDAKSDHYSSIADIFRPSHADYTYFAKYRHRDYRGGGRSSARETITRVVAGSLAKQILSSYGIKIFAYTNSVGNVKLEKDYTRLDLNSIYSNDVRCPEAETAQLMREKILEVKHSGDTIGGTVKCIIQNLPAGLGEPVFDKFHARLAYAMMSINAARGFEIGRGFEAARMKGSEHNDIFTVKDSTVTTLTNNSGGVQGGITNGQDVVFNVAFKPVATIFKKQNTVNTKLEQVEFVPQGRHDPCVVPRAVIIVETMAAMVTLDFLLTAKTLNSGSEF